MKRREFIGKTSVGAAATAAAFYIPGFAQQRKLKIGLLGAGWYGMVDINAALKTGKVEVIGVCDIDTAHLKTSCDDIEKIQGYRPKEITDYQDLIDLKGLEALFIGTMPHWHALQFIAACKKGLDIYCEKPLSYDITEGIAMVKAAEKAGNIVQVGFQRRHSKAYAKAKELINSGSIGNVLQVVPQIHYNPGPQDTTIQAPPATLDWEKWCGPAPKLEYRPSIGHKSWRLEKEYGNGHLVDWGVHHIDIVRKVMDETMPIEFDTFGGIYSMKGQITTPDTLTAKMNFRKIPVVWQHRMWGNGDVSREFMNGIFFYGEKGTIFSDDNKVVTFGTARDSKRADIALPSPDMQDNHVAGFINAVLAKDRSLITCTPADALMSTATVQLAMISYYTQSIVKWNPETMTITDNPAATKLLRREYRQGYVHP